MEKAEESRNLMAQVEALPDDYREVVMLYYYQDVTYRDLAQTLGVSPATINARLTKARAMLRRAVAGNFQDRNLGSACGFEVGCPEICQ